MNPITRREALQLGLVLPMTPMFVPVIEAAEDHLVEAVTLAGKLGWSAQGSNSFHFYNFFQEDWVPALGTIRDHRKPPQGFWPQWDMTVYSFGLDLCTFGRIRDDRPPTAVERLNPLQPDLYYFVFNNPKFQRYARLRHAEFGLLSDRIGETCVVSPPRGEDCLFARYRFFFDKEPTNGT